MCDMERHGNTLFVPKLWEDHNDVLFGKLIPASGPAETLEGEMLRAVNRIIYRYYNDGDYWYTGYGRRTAGPAVAFLISSHIPDSLHSELLVILKDSDGAVGNSYEIKLFDLLKVVIEYVESKQDYTKTDLDMQDFKLKRHVHSSLRPTGEGSSK
jgi:hypothetical protein